MQDLVCRINYNTHKSYAGHAPFEWSSLSWYCNGL